MGQPRWVKQLGWAGPRRLPACADWVVHGLSTHSACLHLLSEAILKWQVLIPAPPHFLPPFLLFLPSSLLPSPSLSPRSTSPSFWNDLVFLGFWVPRRVLQDLPKSSAVIGSRDSRPMASGSYPAFWICGDAENGPHILCLESPCDPSHRKQSPPGDWSWTWDPVYSPS